MKNIIKNILKKNTTKKQYIFIDDSTVMHICCGEANHENMELAKSIIADEWDNEYWRIYIA